MLNLWSWDDVFAKAFYVDISENGVKDDRSIQWTLIGVYINVSVHSIDEVRSKNKESNQVHLGEPMSLLGLVKRPHRLEVMSRSMGD